VPKILHVDRISLEQKELFQELLPPGYELIFRGSEEEDRRFEEELPSTLYLTVNTAPVPAELMARAKSLRFIQKLGAGYDNIDVEYATQRGIQVARTPGANSISVAELVFGLALSLYRKLPQVNAQTRSGKWNPWEYRTVSYELFGKRLGLIGLGNIGQEVAKRALAFDMEVVYYKRHLLPAEKTPGVTAVSMSELLATADIISIHIPLTPETRGLIGRDEFNAMKESAILINTSRGGIVDEEALLVALRERQIAGAALDVCVAPPLATDHPLFAFGNFILTPHVGAATRDADTRVLKMAYENIERIERGEQPHNLVN
jgi:phosphoglycerate dehydrogenase-like enzyme